MMDDFDGGDFDRDAYTPRTVSMVNSDSYGAVGYGNANGIGVARHLVVDNLRRPSSPRGNGGMYEQRVVRSASSSIKDYALGGNGSTDTFNI